MNKRISIKDKIFVAGATGMVGQAICRALVRYGYCSLQNGGSLLRPRRDELDLLDINQVHRWFSSNEPDVVVIAAAKVGGIYANDTMPADFLLDNLKIQNNIIETSFKFGVKRLLFLGSSCIYPLNAKNPISESSFLSGMLEPTNSPYAMAKITAIEIGRSIGDQYGTKVLNLMPTNLYGPFDNFSENDSHVIPGLIYRMYNAKVNNEKEFVLWGTGTPLREFLYSEDLADAIEFLLDKDLDTDLVNVGSGNEVTIEDLAFKIKNILDYKGEIIFDKSRPDGNPRKLLDSSLINSLGWSAKTSLDKGLTSTFDWFSKNKI